MKLVKYYFLNDSKFLLLVPIVLFFTAFYIHYEMIMSCQINLFRNTNINVANEILNNERDYFQFNFEGNVMVYFLQILGTIFCLNIGLLFYVQKSVIVYHPRRIKVNHPCRVKVSHLRRRKVNH